mmetsp:Transcript_3378/g.6828  ORF Transcript_3378/g.6828 Transcript_3378/m.6828 type:complete len:166 (+) Transcript_3378:851-1348(+)
MAGPEGIVLALFSFAKSGNSAELSQSGESVPSSRQHFVRVALVGHVPDDVVLGHVEDVVQGHGELDDAEGGGEVPARFGDGLDELPSEFVGQLFEFSHVEAFHVAGVVDGIEDGLGGGAAVGRAAGGGGGGVAGGLELGGGGGCSRGKGGEGRGGGRGCQEEGRY